MKFKQDLDGFLTRLGWCLETNFWRKYVALRYIEKQLYGEN
jgi:hypothetical protein